MRHILKHWHGQSAFAAASGPGATPGPAAAQALAQLGAHDLEADQLPINHVKDQSNNTGSKLTLLVWCTPGRPQYVPAAAPELDAQSLRSVPPVLVEAWHVIPVTQLEAAKFHHIPVGLRESLISKALRDRISLMLTALHASMQHIDII